MDKTLNMTPKMEELLTKLRGAYESEITDKDGAKWGSVYLPNMGSGRSFAGVLSRLEKAGLYKKYSGGDGMYRDIWGYVRIKEY